MWSRRRSRKQQVKIKPLPTVTMKKDGDEEMEMNSLTDPTTEGEDNYYFEDPSNIGMGDNQSFITFSK